MLDGGTVRNSGTIAAGLDGSGHLGDAVAFGSHVSLLTALPGAVFIGAVHATPAAHDTLQLAGAAPATLAGLGTQFTGFAKVNEVAGAHWTLSGSSNMAFVNAGNVLAGAGGLAFLGSVVDSGVIDAGGGSVQLGGRVTGAGTLAAGAGGSVSLGDGAGFRQTIAFNGGGSLTLSHPLDVRALIAGFAAGCSIDLPGTPETAFGFSAGQLNIRDHGVPVAHLRFDGSYTAANFNIGSDGHGGTLIGFRA